VSGADATVQAILIGYRTATVTARVGDANVQIALEQTAVSLDEVVVTGTAGAQRVRSLGNAVGKVQVSEIIQIAPPPNMQALLSSEVPGLQVQLSSGEIGAGANIRIRGAGSMSLSSEPLLYVDGVRVNNNFADGGGGIASVGVIRGRRLRGSTTWIRETSRASRLLKALRPRPCTGRKHRMV